jgi:hypothetical protein
MHRLAQHRQITDAALGILMHRRAGLLTATAMRCVSGIGFQADLDPVRRRLKITDAETLPKREQGFTI